jgi:hypothetical protein
MVPETRLTSYDLLILVEQPVEPVPPSDTVGSRWSWAGSGRRERLAEGAVRPVIVVLVVVMV